MEKAKRVAPAPTAAPRRRQADGAEPVTPVTRRVRIATAVGAAAVLLWAVLALLASFTTRLPPFEVTAVAFAIAFLLALGKWLLNREAPLAHFRQPAAAWAVGVGGLFGYHFLYFFAMQHAPAVEVSLIAYLWPLLIVVLAAFLPNERLGWWHVAGALMGLAGTVVLVTGGGAVALRTEHALGYALALGCAFTWSSYSVLSRRLAAVPTDAVGAFCLATAALAFLCHLGLETWVAPTPGEWAALLALGLGPVGLAFFAWDVGVKHGSIKALGGLSYATPLLSTLLLVATGRAAPSLAIALACLLVVGGAVLAARELWDPGATARR
jgi:drug/metabolite transporter (DMT)-like permease